MWSPCYFNWIEYSTTNAEIGIRILYRVLNFKNYVKKGDIVKINKLDPHGKYPSGVCSSMIKLSGKVAVIDDVFDLNRFKISIDNGEYTWNKEMFENGDDPLVFSESDLPIELYSSIFGKMSLVNISGDSDYPYDLKLSDGDIISVTKDFKFFKDSEKSIFS